jgi:hypothetical protein
LLVEDQDTIPSFMNGKQVRLHHNSWN